MTKNTLSKMTHNSSGIYILSWDRYRLIYIGMSIDMNRRFKSHKYLMSYNKHYNYKVQEAYNLYGLPSIDILEYVDTLEITTLPFKEISWIHEFDSFNNGLNLTTGGEFSYGDKHPNSKYSNSKIIEVFLSLYNRDIPHKYISEVLEVSIDVIKAISNGYAHKWLSSIYPDEYDTLINNKYAIHPKGDEHHSAKYSNDRIVDVFKLLIDRKIPLLEVSKLTNISYGVVSNIACGGIHKWLEALYPIEYSKMLSNKNSAARKVYPQITNGIDIVEVTNAAEFCRINGLSHPNLSKVFNKERKQHKGWRLLNE